MKFFTRSLVTAVALACAFAPLSAQAAQNNLHRSKPVHQSYQKHHVQKPVVKRHVVKRHVWARGQKVSDWKRRPAVRDYRRYGLRAPARGQQWVKVDNSYLLVSLATGLIVGLAAGH